MVGVWAQCVSCNTSSLLDAFILRVPILQKPVAIIDAEVLKKEMCPWRHCQAFDRPPGETY